ncbi:MAG: 2-C-methyl-D-erythritol 2,4-cyclodiphosphate synthase [Actinobacteria bacterium]|nr:MAG: 2-C-methyl-D-erythritol 2,4-cyclodiphosphate synthase [Actinomycetota bacterium]
MSPATSRSRRPRTFAAPRRSWRVAGWPRPSGERSSGRPRDRSARVGPGPAARPGWRPVRPRARAGDVGQHFSDSDPAFRGIGGLDLLGRTVALLAEAGRTAESCDMTVVADRPHVSPRRDEIRATLAATLGVPADAVSVKATRPEGLGLSGDGVGCFAVAIVRG